MRRLPPSCERSAGCGDRGWRSGRGGDRHRPQQVDIAPGQTPQNVQSQLLNEIQNSMGGEPETVDTD